MSWLDTLGATPVNAYYARRSEAPLESRGHTWYFDTYEMGGNFRLRNKSVHGIQCFGFISIIPSMACDYIGSKLLPPQ